MAITPLPTPVPNRGMSEEDFATAGDNFLGALPVFVTEANALQADVNSKQVTATDAATTATTQATNASNSAVAAAASEAAALEYKNGAEAVAAAFQSTVGLPSLVGNAGKALSVNASATAVEWAPVTRIGDVKTTALTLTAPTWLLCDGSIYLKSSYPALSSALGSIFSNTPWTSSAPGANIGTSGAVLSAVKAPNGNIITNDGANTSAHYSTNDGLTWSTSTMTTSAERFAVGSTAVVGVSGTTATTVSTTNGVSWVAGGAMPTAASYIFSNGASTFVATDSGQTSAAVRYSTNSGTSWSASTLPVNSSWEVGGFGGGLFMLVGYVTTGSGPVATSPDGITWTAKTSIGTRARRIAYGSGRWLVCQENAGVTSFVYSDDNGSSWRAASDLPESASITCLVYISGIGFVAGSSMGGKLFVSTDGSSGWTKYTGVISVSYSSFLAGSSGNSVLAMPGGANYPVTVFRPLGYDTTTSFAVPTINSPSTTGGVRAYIKGAA